jgi:HEAT repeat protein
MYAPGHPFLRERVGSLHGALTAQAGKEPSGVLFLGVARDKVLYQDRFFEARHPIVLAFAEELYRHHVATIGFSCEATPTGLASFFRCIRDLQTGKIEEIPEGYLQRLGIRGIYISPVNYKEVLSRGIVGRNPLEDSMLRGETLWRTLLSGPGGEEAFDRWVAEELSEFPEVLPVLLGRMRAGTALPHPAPAPGIPPAGGWSSAREGAPPGGGTSPKEFAKSEGSASPEVVPQTVLRRMFRRLGERLKTLPAERRKRVLEAIGEGMGEGDGFGFGPGGGAGAPDPFVPMARSLSEGYTDAEFLELLAGLLSTEGKGGKRLLHAFRIITAERDVDRSLLPLLETWSKEGRHAKEYYAGKTWEAVERLLLERSEGAYFGDDYSKFLESLPAGQDRKDGEPDPAREIGPDLVPILDPGAIRRKGVAVLLDLLLQDLEDPDLQDLLDAVQGAIPGLIEGKEFALLKRTLDAVAAAGDGKSADRREMASNALAAVDFRRLAEECLSGPAAAKECGEGLEILARHGDRSAAPLLDRLLVEPDKGMRKVLLSLLVRIGEPAVPAIVERLQDHPWYFLRNLCFILGAIGASATVPGLVRMLAHKELRVRREAIHALGKLRATDPDAVLALGRILLAESLFSAPKEDPVRIDAASALSRIGGADALSYLHRGKASRRAAVRDHCEALLRTRGRE